MYKYLNIILKSFLIFLALLLTSCNISSPEKLLQPPQLNITKKEIKDAVEKFTPQNTIDYSIQYTQEEKSTNMIIKDLDNDGENEVISFYRSKITDKIGMVILKKDLGTWQKDFEIFFDTFEIYQIWVDDLNDDAKREIVLQSYSYDVANSTNDLNAKKFTVVYQDKEKKFKYTDFIPYNVMTIGSLIDHKNKKEIVLCEKATNKEEENITNLVIYNFDGDKLIKKIGKTLAGISDPYNIIVGNATQNNIGIFLNLLNEKFYATTRIFFYDEKQNQILNAKDLIGFDDTSFILNLESKDIDKDGIIEVGYYFKSPNYTVPVEDMSVPGLINGYFKISSGNKIELIREIYNNVGVGYSINFPKSFKGKYSLKTSEDGNDVYVSYVSSDGKEYPLFNILKIEKWKYETDIEKYENMQTINFGVDYTILGNVEDYSENLYNEAKEEYIQLRNDILILENIVEVQKY